jgi:citronellol/citronellal dehydrogenase
MKLQNKTIFITGSTRGIGRAIALKCAKEGANIVVTGKTTEPHEKLEGTIYSVAQEIEALGAKALAIQLDVRSEEQIQQAVNKTVETFGGIDILINNASAISLTDTLNTPMKKFDLMFGVNVRATFACVQACIPYLEKSQNPHILTLSPPLNMDAKWFKKHLAYTMSKYGMSMCTLGLAEELKSKNIAVNSLWPKTLIATAAVKYNLPADLYQKTRQPEIMADATYYIIQQPSSTWTGKFFIDEDILTQAGEIDFDKYATYPGVGIYPDLYI